MTGRELVTKALRKAGIITRGETPAAEEVNDLIDDLNMLLGSWLNSSTLVPYRVLESFDLTSAIEYTIGPGQDFDTVKPLKIVKAYVESEYDYPVKEISEEAYANITDKDTLGRPYYLSFDNAYPHATIKLFPKPDQPYKLFILSEKPLSELDLDTEVTLPPGWDKALIENLAVMVLPEYGMEPSQILLKSAADSKSAITAAILRNRSFDVAPPGVVHDIYTGWNT